MGLRRLAVLGLLVAGGALAGRNSSGTYSLPAGNPVVTLTTISSTWANNTLSDLGVEITNSLDRNGRGCMLAPLQASSGTVAAPGLTFCAETGSGLFRAQPGDIALAIQGTQVERWTASTSTDTLSLKLSVTPPGVATNSAIIAQGVGAGMGIQATAGSSATLGGVYGSGGTGSASGGYFSGGSGGGPGVTAGGSGAGAGGVFLGGASGVGSSSSGGAGQVGGTFANGTASLAGTPQNALQLVSGNLLFSPAVNVTKTLAMTNVLAPNNTPKAWALIHSINGAGTVTDGFNVSSCALQGTNVRCTLAAPMANANYGVWVTTDDVLRTQFAIAAKSTSTFDIQGYVPNGGAVDFSLVTTDFHFLVFGQQ